MGKTNQPTRGTALGGPRRSDDVLRRLLAMIYEGKLAPGSRLPAERELARSLTVSRTTLRDALNRLEARGLLERRPQSGSYVRTTVPPSLSEPIEEILGDNLTRFADLIEIRKILELWAATRAAQHGDAGRLEELHRLLRVMRRNSSLASESQVRAYREADATFHQVIAQMTGNPIYVHLIHFLTRLISQSVVISQQLMPGDFAKANQQVHQRIYDALKAGDVEAAQEAMRNHFAFVERRLKLGRRKPGRRNPRKTLP
jgi:GntR family transcriptional repressor for pyruvate dehydrogenase complex